MTDLAGVPDLDDVAGEMVDAAELAHLPSLRNQRGQAHVNDDLTSVSWLAAPPYTLGYHTGRLRLDGMVLPAQRYLWKPWGVRRSYADESLVIETDTRMLLDRDVLTWRTTVVNTSPRPRTYTVSQGLNAAVASSETGWGWLYDQPWNAGDYYDYFTTERIRDSATEDMGYLVGPGPRRLRLGRARVPGIQRDEDSAPMLLEYELPAHVSTDKVVPRREAARGTVRDIRVVASGKDEALVYAFAAPVHLEPATEVTLHAFELSHGSTLSFSYRPAGVAKDGIILTHGNHPDSLQLGVHDGRLWVAVAGQRTRAAAAMVDGRWHSIAVRIGHACVTVTMNGELVAAVSAWPEYTRWDTRVDGVDLVVRDRYSEATAAYSCWPPPSILRSSDGQASADWTVTLEPGNAWTVAVALAYGDSLSETLRQARDTAVGLEQAHAASRDGWSLLWRAMFDPESQQFSGSMPVLCTEDIELRRAYYMSALVPMYMRNTSVSATEPTFLTGGPRLGPTTTYFWDHTEWSRLYTLLEPAGLRSWLLRVLSGPYSDSFGIDVRQGGPLGNEYSSTDYSLFRLTEHYISITGDVAFLDETAASSTVAEHLVRLARGWERRRTKATGGVLADFGDDPWRLLECVPNYVNVVAGFNAAYVRMMRSLAHLHRYRGEEAKAQDAVADAERLAKAVIALYAGQGRWSILHADGSESIGHCLDFGLVAAALAEDLPSEVRTEMVQFVSDKLVTGSWMRALAVDDPVATFSDRPDHGAGGAFCAWPGTTAHGLAELGRPDLALSLLRATPGAASGALWGQAQELVGNEQPQRFRVAARGVSNRDSIGATAIAESVLSGLFGFDRTFADLASTAHETSRQLSLTAEGIGSLILNLPVVHGAELAF